MRALLFNRIWYQTCLPRRWGQPLVTAAAPPPLPIREQLPGAGQEADPDTPQTQRNQQSRREHMQPHPSYPEEDASTPEREHAEARQEQNQQEKSRKEKATGRYGKKRLPSLESRGF